MQGWIQNILSGQKLHSDMLFLLSWKELHKKYNCIVIYGAWPIISLEYVFGNLGTRKLVDVYEYILNILNK